MNILLSTLFGGFLYKEFFDDQQLLCQQFGDILQIKIVSLESQYYRIPFQYKGTKY